jgi:dGTP triphosphohydrolase
MIDRGLKCGRPTQSGAGVVMELGYHPGVPEEWKKRGEVLLHQAVRIFYSDKAVPTRRDELLAFAKAHANDQAVQDQVAGYMEALAMEEDAAKGS